MIMIGVASTFVSISRAIACSFEPGVGGLVLDGSSRSLGSSGGKPEVSEGRESAEGGRFAAAATLAAGLTCPVPFAGVTSAFRPITVSVLDGGRATGLRGSERLVPGLIRSSRPRAQLPR